MIVNRVSEVMGRKRLTIREVARRSGLAYATVQGIRNDSSKRVDWDTLDALCRTLEVGSLCDLFEYQPEGSGA
jgi:putative transcriptional regulator